MDIWLIAADGEVIDAAVNERMALAAAEGVARAGLTPTIRKARAEVTAEE